MEQRFSIDSCGQSVVRIQRWVRHEGVKEKKSGDGGGVFGVPTPETKNQKGEHSFCVWL